MTDSITTPKLGRNRTGASFAVGSANVAFGCEHIEDIFKTGGEVPWRSLVSCYMKILVALRDENPIVTQSYKEPKTAGTAHVTIRPNWCCIHCPFIYSEDQRKTHWISKEHCFFVETRSACLYCSQCEDFVFDPTLEPLRLMNGSRKRKFDEFVNPDDYRTIPGNSSHAPCRAIGLRGLYNMGNTCFMSVIIQTLLHNPLIKSYYLSNGHNSTDCTIEYCLSCALDEIFNEFYTMEKTEGYGAVTMLMNSWKTAESTNNDLAGYHQQDAHEYMQFLLNSLHAANGGQTNGSCNCVIHRTFYGRLQSVVTCDKCHNRTEAVDPFMDLSLDLRSQVKNKLSGDKKKDGGSKGEASLEMRLEECLKRFTSKEKLPAAEYKCKKCDAQRDATKQFGILTLPPCLCIHLKRFSHSNDKSTKLGTPVKFPLILNTLPYTTLYVSPSTLPKTSLNSSATSKPGKAANGDAESGGQYASLLAVPKENWSPKMITYVLSAVIVHKGEINSGHYVNYARKGADWFLFDDSKVVLVDEADVLRAEAYLLVYVIEDLGPWAEDVQQKKKEVDPDEE